MQLCKYISTLFYLGKLPAPGTLASGVALATYWLAFNLFQLRDVLCFGAVANVALFLLGWPASSMHARRLGEPDPGEIVIDELAGQLLALNLLHWLNFFIGHYFTFTLSVVCFCIFRFLDIFKPWPINWVDSNVKGGLGIMLDDTLAGVLAGSLTFLLGVCFR